MTDWYEGCLVIATEDVETKAGLQLAKGDITRLEQSNLFANEFDKLEPRVVVLGRISSCLVEKTRLLLLESIDGIRFRASMLSQDLLGKPSSQPLALSSYVKDIFFEDITFWCASFYIKFTRFGLRRLETETMTQPDFILPHILDLIDKKYPFFHLSSLPAKNRKQAYFEVRNEVEYEVFFEIPLLEVASKSTSRIRPHAVALPKGGLASTGRGQSYSQEF